NSDGAITISVTGGESPYKFEWASEAGYTSTSEKLINIPSGIYQVTVTDAKMASTNFSGIEVKVEDNVDPAAIAQDFTVQLDAAGNASITADQIDNKSNDACGIANIFLDKTSFSCSKIGANTVTLTVTDNNGNVSTATATVTVE